jgi:uncharacterized membrane protein
MKLLIPLLLLVLGEAIFVYCEMMIAKGSNILLMFIISLIAGSIVIAGYYYGYKYGQNIWIVTATSIGSILVTEPIISWSLFHEIPTRGATLGLIFGVIGLMSTLTF